MKTTNKISIETIKTLRDKTGAPLGDVRSALEEAGGDETKANAILKQKGLAAAKKREGRTTSNGRIESYVHHDGRVAALVEVDCETDFVARLPEFQQFCRDVAMQVASQNPVALKQSDLKPEHLQLAKEMGKSAEQYARDFCLLEQPFIKDASQSIGSLLTTLVAKTGENIVVRRVVRYQLGEESKA